MTLSNSNIKNPLIAKNEDILFIVVDLFCGFGGTTLGFEKSGVAKVVACVNHDPLAIQSHLMNHPDVLHFQEDIRKLDLTALINHVNRMKVLFPNAKLILWASLECTNFSKAKGGQARNADSRTLADHLDRYVIALNPEVIQIENVVEFMAWGPLNENGKPVSRKNGIDWLNWRARIKSFGYEDEWREINSANFGSYTSRNRLFGIFVKKGLPIIWPSPTHSKQAAPQQDLFGGSLQKWKAVKDVLDFSNEGKSIFRDIPLAENTLKGIYAGLLKFSTIEKRDKETTNGVFLKKYYGTGGVTSINRCADALTCKDRFAMVNPKYLKIDRSKTQTEYFINRAFSSVTNSSIHKPAGAILRVPKLNLVTIKKSFLWNPSWGGKAVHSINNPSPVVIARQDKSPLYLITAKSGDIAIEVYETDSPYMVKIKEFMIENHITDILFRCLFVHELLRIQGFPSTYRMVGSQADKKKFIGNSVEPIVPYSWIRSMSIPYSQLLQAA